MCSARHRPDWYVRPGVADVLEIRSLKILLQRRKLVFPCKVQSLGTGNHFRENSQVPGDHVRYSTRRSCDEQDLAAAVALLGKPPNELLIVWKTARIQVRVPGGFILQIGSTSQPPDRKEQHESRVAFPRRNQALPQCVGAYKGTVQIDADGDEGLHL